MNDNNKNLIIASLVVAVVAGYYFYNKGLAAAAAVPATTMPAATSTPATVVTPVCTMTIPVMPLPTPTTSQVALTDASYEAVLNNLPAAQLQNVNNEAQVFINNKGLHNSWLATCETNYCSTTGSSLIAIQPNLKEIIFAVNNGMPLIS